MGKALNIEKVLAGSDSDEILVNEFTEESAQDFRDRVLAVAKHDPQEPIIVYIDSYGGSADSLAKMIETMDEVPNPVITVAIGKAMSCGAILLSHGCMRFCGPHSRVMIHEVSGGAVGDVHDVKADAREMERLNRHFIGLLANNCKIKGGYDALRKMIKDQDGRDNYMDAEQSKKFGIVDAIGLPRVTKIHAYQIDIAPPKTRLQIEQKKPKKKSESKK